jgi:hypothetical protein
MREKSLTSAARHLDRIFENDWPALRRFKAAAERYDPEARFLATLARVTGSA